MEMREYHVSEKKQTDNTKYKTRPLHKISITEKERAFNFRTAALILRGREVLFHTIEGNNFWVLPGGRVHMGESSIEALHREIAEELGARIEIVRPLWVVENFFVHQNKLHQNIGFYYLTRFKSPCDFYDTNEVFQRQEGEETLLFQWMSPDKIQEETCFPAFLKERVNSLPSVLEHVVHWDDVSPDIIARGLE